MSHSTNPQQLDHDLTLSTKPLKLKTSHQTMPQQLRYTRSMLEAKICLIGTAQQLLDVCRPVAWSVRKFAEAIASGCAVIGDIPADLNLARFVQERLTGQGPLEIAWSAELALERFKVGRK